MRERAATRRAAVVALVLAGCVGCDHATKQLAQQALREAGSASILLDAVQFELAYNTGGFLSGSGASLLGLGLVAGGGAANWLDRVLNAGAVTDFVRIDLGVARTGIFNLADVFVLAGAALFLLAQTGGASPPESPGRDA
jgi:signal peptidase II